MKLSATLVIFVLAALQENGLASTPVRKRISSDSARQATEGIEFGRTPDALEGFLDAEDEISRFLLFMSMSMSMSLSMSMPMSMSMPILKFPTIGDTSSQTTASPSTEASDGDVDSDAANESDPSDGAMISPFVPQTNEAPKMEAIAESNEGTKSISSSSGNALIPFTVTLIVLAGFALASAGF